ncbi:MAG: DUF2489 domain-containing protein, partial [Pseudomonadales bacterium]|nr:DUF2489 domain-containing protein [Pseudomonadales bacterium]
MPSSSNSNLDPQQELVLVAKSMLDGSLNLIEGVREICELRKATNDPEDELFFSIRAIDSETEHFPIGRVRKECSGPFLKRADLEMKNYLSETKEVILK